MFFWCLCQPAKVMNINKRVRVFDSHGHAEQDKLVQQEARLDAHGMWTDSYTTCSCRCHTGYVGESCERALAQACPYACSGHGQCGLDGSCTCDAGYEGVGCHIASAVCPSSCSGHGRCHTLDGSAVGICRCARGYTSSSCAVWSAEGPSSELIATATATALSSSSINAARTPTASNSTVEAAAAAPNAATDLWSPAATSAGATAAAAATASAEGRSWSPRTWVQYSFVAKAALAAVEAVRHELGADVVPELACPSACSGRGLCSPSGACACADGYTGAACHLLTFSCKANCSGASQILPPPPPNCALSPLDQILTTAAPSPSPSQATVAASSVAVCATKTPSDHNAIKWASSRF